MSVGELGGGKVTGGLFGGGFIGDCEGVVGDGDGDVAEACGAEGYIVGCDIGDIVDGGFGWPVGPVGLAIGGKGGGFTQLWLTQTCPVAVQFVP